MAQGRTTGLSGEQVRARADAGLRNAVPNGSSRSLWNILRANVFTLFNAIVGSSFLLLLALGQWRDALFGFAALGNAVIGIVQEYRAKRTLDRLAVLQLPGCRVLRAGEVREIAVDDVVQDDILVLRAGDQLVVDALLLDGHGLELDESLLSGESVPVAKFPGMELLSGSIVVAGRGAARAIRVGSESYANRLVAEARRFSLLASEIRRGIDRVLRWVSWALLPVSVLLVNAQMQAQGGWEHAWSSGSWKHAATGAVAGIIAMIPLGLVLLTSVAFAVGALRLSRDRVLIQELAAVEGLARVDVLCIDKTGTLTHGRITFDAVHDIDGAGHPGWQEVLGWFGADADANATARCLAGTFTADGLPEAGQRVPFSSATKWSAVSFSEGREASGTWVLGAPDVLLPAGSPTAVRASALAAEGLRTLALSHASGRFSVARGAARELPHGLEPVVLLTFREEIRPDAAQTLAFFAQEGVSVKVISGDDPRTVGRVAQRVGLGTGEGCDARLLPEDPRLLEEAMEKTVVFGRVSPSQKKAMVQALERQGHTVAMIGDGVNDVLALKEADLGIAMDSAAPATKAVARVVLLDGRFDRLPSVLAEGRRVIANIERVSVLFLSKTVYALTLSVAVGVLLLDFPFLPRQLSVTDGLTIGIPAFFLALMPNLRRYQPGFLKRSLRLALPAGFIIAAALLAITGFGSAAAGDSTGAVRTAAVVALSLLGLCLLAVVSRPVNAWSTAIAAAMSAVLVLVLSVPVFQDFLDFEQPSPELLAVTAVVTVPAAACIFALGRGGWLTRGGGSRELPERR
ncbi:HAD-IC family P-type ATPase [Arthrobacter silvisoli]|uniref:HAD-IC family P-type ATPase n=1 Tax=Arthrobacter silvisoli TaxID=2291022 RepID=UPI000E211374|nr:HAD-IC family P-type ATPase [Arthrobacter silvisoli]